jgi:hypothetical protein
MVVPTWSEIYKMAIPYTQDWSAGNSTFTSVNSYTQSGNGVDPVYPEMKAAEVVTITGGKLDWNGTASDYQSAGIWVAKMGTLSGGGIGQYSGSGFWSGNQGYIECTYVPNATSLAVLLNAPLITIPAPAGLSSYMQLSYNVSGGQLELSYLADSGGVSFDPVATSALPSAGVPYKVKLEWQLGTWNGTDHDPDGFVKVYINDQLERSDTGIDLYFTYNSSPEDKIDGVWFGYLGLLGTLDDITISDSIAATPPPVVPPTQRAGYVLFSNDIVEKQSETRFTKTFLQLLAADPPPSPTPIVLTLTEVIGDLYDQQGNNITTGRLYVTPRRWLVASTQLIAKTTISYDITGPISLNLAASNGVLYDVEYDPDPNDTVTPINLKTGYFRDIWDIPVAATVDIATL